MVENANLRAEVNLLRVENKELMRRVRFSDNNAHFMRVSGANKTVLLIEIDLAIDLNFMRVSLHIAC